MCCLISLILPSKHDFICMFYQPTWFLYLWTEFWFITRGLVSKCSLWPKVKFSELKWWNDFTSSFFKTATIFSKLRVLFINLNVYCFYWDLEIVIFLYSMLHQGLKRRLFLTVIQVFLFIHAKKLCTLISSSYLFAVN